MADDLLSELVEFIESPECDVATPPDTAVLLAVGRRPPLPFRGLKPLVTTPGFLALQNLLARADLLPEDKAHLHELITEKYLILAAGNLSVVIHGSVHFFDRYLPIISASQRITHLNRLPLQLFKHCCPEVDDREPEVERLMMSVLQGRARPETLLAPHSPIPQHQTRADALDTAIVETLGCERRARLCGERQARIDKWLFIRDPRSQQRKVLGAPIAMLRRWSRRSPRKSWRAVCAAHTVAAAEAGYVRSWLQSDVQAKALVAAAHRLARLSDRLAVAQLSVFEGTEVAARTLAPDESKGE